MGEIEGVTEIALMPVDTLGEFYQRVEAVVKPCRKVRLS